jgi:hypothetical protein
VAGCCEYGDEPLGSGAMELVNSACTSRRTLQFTITKINWLMLFKEIIAANSENYTKQIDTLCG